MKQLIGLIFLTSVAATAQVPPPSSTIPNLVISGRLGRATCTDTTPLKIPVLVGNNLGVPVSALLSAGPTSGGCPPSVPTGQTATPIPSCNVDSSGFVQCLTYSILLPGSPTSGVCSGDGGGTNPPTAYNYLCLYNNSSALIGQITYQYDTTPTPIEIASVSGGNAQATINLKNNKTSTIPNYSTTYRVCYDIDPAVIDAIISSGAADCGGKSTKDSTSLQVQITGLENFKKYYFTASAAGAPPIWTARQDFSPVATAGFAGAYDGAPNPLSFGCHQTSAGPEMWVLFLLLGILLRRKLDYFKLFLIPILFFSASVSADLGQINLGIIGSVYRPNLDASTKSDGSQARSFYGTIFNNKLLPLMGLELDVHLLDDFGSLQLGCGLAYTYTGGNALLRNPDQTLTNNTSADSAGLHMLHLRPQLTYILDPWVETFPLAPYLRTGIIAASYLFTYQGGLDKENDANKPIGVIFGWEAAFGLMFMLDFLEPSVSKTARANDTYDHVYLKAEAAYMPMNNFYKNGLNFSSSWPTPNFPLLLTFGLVFEFK